MVSIGTINLRDRAKDKFYETDRLHRVRQTLLFRGGRRDRAAVAKSEEVVFIGYSLPKYDSFAVKTLKTLCAEKQVTVYDPSEDTLERFCDEFRNAVVQRSRFNATPFAASATA